jgi:hypothetical protein
MEGVKGKGGGRYRLQTLVHRKYVNQEWCMHCARQEPSGWSGGHKASMRQDYFSKVACWRFSF